MHTTRSLVDILKDEPTDKIANGLAAYYDELFGSIRYNVQRILEIGIDKGGSIRGWREFFLYADVWGIDIRGEALESVGLGIEDRVFLLCGNIADGNARWWKDRFRKESFDIVIDDGSHINTDVFAAFEVLWPFVLPGGYYVVEDIQVPYRDSNHPTIGAYFLNFVKEHKIMQCEFRSNVLWIRKPDSPLYAVTTNDSENEPPDLETDDDFEI